MKIIYTDGSCLKNPGGAGGWAICLIKDNGREYLISEGNPHTTNNRMELQAIIEAVSCVEENEECLIYSDSQLSINCCDGKWKRKANLDLWKEYDNKSVNKKIRFKWVKAHNGDKYNEIVDKLARSEAKKMNFK
jgi:ribonuclease HI